MYPVESSVAVFEELQATLNTKGMRGLNNVRIACDFIVSAKGIMNYSRVGDVAEKQLGGPKKQSIQNNEKLKRYISARINEYHGSKDGPREHSLPKCNEHSSWPENNLSSRVKIYITQLRTRLEMVEKRYQDLRFLQEKQTRVEPVSMVNAIERGDTEGYLTIQYPEVSNEELKMAVQSLLKLGEYIKTLQTETINSRTGLVLKRPSGDVVILTPSQYEHIIKFLDD